MTTTTSSLPALLQYLQSAPIATLIVIPAVLIVLDIASGIASALKMHVFTLRRIANFVGNDFLLYVVLVGAIAGFYLMKQVEVATYLATYVGLPALSLKIFDSIVRNLTEVSPPLAQFVQQLGTLLGLQPKQQ